MRLRKPDISELMMRDTVLIYDAVRGPQESLKCFPCERLIYSSPNVGDLKLVSHNIGLKRFVWTVEETDPAMLYRPNDGLL